MYDELLIQLASFSDDPLGFVYAAFPWGEGELAQSEGPDRWQIEILLDLQKGLITLDEAIQLARTSGHGIGKSALVSWLILWALSTFEDTMGVVTANTETQLKTKTWAQLAKWFRLFIGRELFQMTATAIFSRDPAHEKTWRVDMVPWSERNTEAFAGLHNLGKRLLVVFDEASAIPDVIWEVTEGALTDSSGTQIIWAVFGNPTRNLGRFRDCFPGGKFAHRWSSKAIDSRESKFTNKAQIQKWIDDYGEDSDFVRVRVRGVFPRIDAVSFISVELATNATRAAIADQTAPVVLGVDVGRFGDDPSVIYPRCGLDARSRPLEVYPHIDTMALAGRIVLAADKYHAAMVFIDEGGVGGGVVDRCRQLGLRVVGVDFGAGPDGFFMRGEKYANKRAEIWGTMRQWLMDGGAIHELVPGQDTSVVDELSGPTYGLNTNEAILLESKKDMRRRGIPSPNVADALATTFALPIFVPPGAGVLPRPPNYSRIPEYDPYALERL